MNSLFDPLRGLRPVHPGEILREDVLPALGLPKADIARRLGVSRPLLYDILNCDRAITPNTALRLEKLLGVSADHWMRMQASYDLRRANDSLAAELEEITRIPWETMERAAGKEE